MKLLFILSILILIFSCSNPNDLQELKDLKTTSFAASDISLVSEGDSVAANGTTYIEAVLRITPKVLERYKEASFDITPVGKFSNGATTQKLAIGTNGEAHVFVSSTAEGIATIKATVGTLSVNKVVKFGKIPTPPISLDTLVLQVVRDSVAADNFSYAEVVAKTKYPGAVASRLVKFTTDKGSFSNDAKEYTLNFGMDSVARVYIKHNRAEPVRVTATVNSSYSRELAVHFLPAWPDQLLIEPGAAALPPSYTATTMVTAKLLRANGTVSPGHNVTFYDSTAGNRSVGVFLNTTRSDNAGLATSHYWIQDTSFHGVVYIKGAIQTDTGKVIGVSRVVVQ